MCDLICDVISCAFEAVIRVKYTHNDKNVIENQKKIRK